MKITVIAPTTIPARRANTIQVMKMTEAIKASGHAVNLLVPRHPPAHGNVPWAELSHHYGISQPFEIEWLTASPHLRSYDYGFRSIMKARQDESDLIFTRHPQAAAFASLIGLPTLYEIHDLPQGTMSPRLLSFYLKGRSAVGLVVITAALRDALASTYSIPKSLPVILAPDGVDLARFKDLPSPIEARSSLPEAVRIPPSAFVVGYTGHLYPGRGVDLMLKIARQLPDIQFLLAGGETKDLSRINSLVESAGLKNITLTGFLPNAELPIVQAACDVLLMPYQLKVAASSGGDISKYLSPMKLFEYMACGRVILSSDLPVLREVLSDGNAVLLPPDDLAAWVNAIVMIKNHPEKAVQLATQAKMDVQRYSLTARTKKILASIES